MRLGLILLKLNLVSVTTGCVRSSRCEAGLMSRDADKVAELRKRQAASYVSVQ